MSHTSPPFALFISTLFQFLGSAPLINAMPYFLSRRFLVSHRVLFLAAIHFIPHRPNRSADGERLTSFCLLVRSPSMRFERSDVHKTKPINRALCGSPDNLIETQCCLWRNLICGQRKGNKIYHGRPVTVYHIIVTCPLAIIPGKTEHFGI